MTARNVIVFGPTGHVGSFTARSAQEYGAKVWLAMRDTAKSIRGLSPEQEAEGGLERVRADLTDPETVRDAVQKSGAKSAFIYLVFGTNDHMRSTIEALKSAGVESVVFLSSSKVSGDIRSAPEDDFIWHTHAQVEAGLEDVFGEDGYVAVRPAYFATNSFLWKTMVQAGDVKMPYPDAVFDWITPQDMGGVCAALLVKGAQAFGGAAPVFLYGPRLLSLREAMVTIGRAVGKEIRVTQVDEDEAVKAIAEGSSLPDFVAKTVVSSIKLRAGVDGEDVPSSMPGEGAAKDNVVKFTGRQPMQFEDWASQNKGEFLAT